MQTATPSVKPPLVEGWLNDREGRRLYQLATQCTGRGVIVEIGSWKGKSTIWIGQGSLAGKGVKIHAVDPHTGSPQHHEVLGQVWTFDQFQRNIKAAEVDSVVVPHVDFSESVAKTFTEPVELIFIDGLHEYEGVKTDFDAWYPKVIDGGWMAFHDSTCWDGVRKVVTDHLFKSTRFRKLGFTSSITYGQKVAHNTFAERVGNRIVLAAFLSYAYFQRLLWRVSHSRPLLPLANALRARLKSKHTVQPERSLGV
jgi:MMP 1-O-methyltransferase